MHSVRPPRLAPSLIFAAAVAVLAAPAPSLAQGKSEEPPAALSKFKPPPMAPIKPYQPVAVTPPQPNNDPAFVAFRQELAAIAARKDRAALARLIVAKGFFWMQDKDLADQRKSGIDNFAKAIDLEAKDGFGWEALSSFAAEPTTAPLPMRPEVICAPANPKLDFKAFEALVEATQTTPPDWGYPTRDGVELRGAAQPNAPVIEKLGLTLVRVLPDSAPPDDPQQPAFLHVAAPSGKAGFVAAELLAGLGGDQICYVKDADGWKIAGYFGGAGE